MTVEKLIRKGCLLVALPNAVDSAVEIFELPHPSNNESKKPIKLFVHDDKVYQLKIKKFSKGCDYNCSRDLVNDKYHYTSDSQTFKSTFLINEENRKDGYILEDGSILYAEKYDLTFNICGYYYRNNKVTSEDLAFITPCVPPALDMDTNFYTSSDYQEKLMNNHSENWGKIPPKLWESCLGKISRTVEEAGDKYYRIEPQMIVEWLLKKVIKINNNFPNSLKIPKSLPEDIASSLKCIMSCNLLVSLIPQLAYQDLISHESSNLNIKQCFGSYDKYKNETLQTEKERELLIKAAMSTGVPNGTKTVKKQPIQKAKVVKPKVAKGKGRIDGFFKTNKT
ncbi:Rnh202 [Kluyveromyces lactis]|nr:Rnh202 [Kluyveromyces lactis]